MSKPDYDEKLPSLWLNVFHNSKVNGAEHREDRLPSYRWSWPTDTYLQRRLRAVRAKAANTPVIVAQNPTLRQSSLTDDTEVPQRQNQRATRRPLDNANRPNAMNTTAKENGLVVEWETIDERLAWFARPNDN